MSVNGGASTLASQLSARPAFQRKISSPIVGFQSTFLLIPKSAAGWYAPAKAASSTSSSWARL